MEVWITPKLTRPLSLSLSRNFQPLKVIEFSWVQVTPENIEPLAKKLIESGSIKVRMPSLIIQNDIAGTVKTLVRLRANFQITELECTLTDFGNQDSAAFYSALFGTIRGANFSADFWIENILPAQKEVKVMLNDGDFNQLFDSIEAWRNASQCESIDIILDLRGDRRSVVQGLVNYERVAGVSLTVCSRAELLDLGSTLLEAAGPLFQHLYLNCRIMMQDSEGSDIIWEQDPLKLVHGSEQFFFVKRALEHRGIPTIESNKPNRNEILSMRNNLIISFPQWNDHAEEALFCLQHVLANLLFATPAQPNVASNEYGTLARFFSLVCCLVDYSRHIDAKSRNNRSRI